MLRERNNMAHIYDGWEAQRLVGRILEKYIPEFQRLEAELYKNYGDMLVTV